MPSNFTFRLARATFAISLIAGFALFSCARIQAPPGGPEDKTPPKIVSTTPEKNALNVPLDEQIVIRWDEYIRPIADGALLLPRIEGTSVKIKGKRLIIEHKEPFKPNTTYRVALSSRISDYRGNRIRGSESFAFSTGDYIDTLEIRGRVFSQKLEPASDMRVEAFISEEDTSLAQSPIAAAWTGEDGRYILRNLPKNNFLVRAFRDINGDGQPNHGEDFAIAPSPVLAGEDISFAMISEAIDTLSPSLLSATAENPFVLRLRFSKDVKLSPESRIAIDSHGEARLLPDIESSRSALVMFAEGFPAREFNFTVDGVEDLRGNELINARGEVEFPAFPDDTLPPRITYTKEPLLPAQELRVKIDRPIIAGEILVEDSSGRGLSGETTIETPYWFVFRPEIYWPQRHDLTWRLACTFADGSEFSDTAQYRIGIRNRATLGRLEVTQPFMFENFIAKAYPIEDASSPIILTKGDEIFIGEFVPEGDYRIFGFWDLDGDSAHFTGSHSPIQLSEPAVIHGDTVRVRGLWTTEYHFRTQH
ncbi:MAG TPA: hypothetical protein ENN07_08385 [candidate division Zixibacteria bacterium]|nr:hypothetical protein [candidate division Zixibacteria bacterium]